MATDKPSAGENERRRSTAREVWLTQLTPEQRAVLLASEAQEAEARAEAEEWGEVPPTSVQRARGASVAMGIVDEVTEGMKYPCHRRHQHQPWCLPVDEMGEALQRSIERRD